MPQEQTTYTLHLPERIDSQNAAAYEEELIRLTGEHPGKVPVFDATDLTYISSAGLRVFMKLSKTLGTSFRILEVSPEVYDIFDTTGFTELLQVKKCRLRLAEESLLLFCFLLVFLFLELVPGQEPLPQVCLI